MVVLVHEFNRLSPCQQLPSGIIPYTGKPADQRGAKKVTTARRFEKSKG